jgi:hypothetical protein
MVLMLTDTCSDTAIPLSCGRLSHNAAIALAAAGGQNQIGT